MKSSRRRWCSMLEWRTLSCILNSISCEMKVRKVSRPFSQIPRAMPSVRQHVNFFFRVGLRVKIVTVVIHVMPDHVHTGRVEIIGY